MWPTFQIGFIHLSTYRIVFTFAAVVIVVIGAVRLYRHAYTVSTIVEAAAWIAAASAIGAYAVPAIERALQGLIVLGPPMGAAPGFRIKLGVSFIGALAAGTGSALGYCHWQGLSLGRSFDLGGIGVPLGQAIGRVGCLAAGCCHGKVTDSWLGMYLPDTQGTWAMRYPTQLMSGVVDLLIFTFLLVFERWRTHKLRKPDGWPFHGYLFLMYTMLYCLKRFTIEFLRETPAPLCGPFTWAHVTSSIGFLAASFLIISNLRLKPLVTS